VGLTYAGLIGKLLGNVSVAEFRMAIPTAFFGRLVFFYSLGIVCGFHLGDLRAWLSQHRSQVYAVLLISAILALLESYLALRYVDMNLKSQVQSIPSSVYAVSFILAFLSIDRIGSSSCDTGVLSTDYPSLCPLDSEPPMAFSACPGGYWTGDSHRFHEFGHEISSSKRVPVSFRLSGFRRAVWVDWFW